MRPVMGRRVVLIPFGMLVVLGLPLSMSLQIRDDRPALLPPGVTVPERTLPTVLPEPDVPGTPVGPVGPAPEVPAVGGVAAQARLVGLVEAAALLAQDEGRSRLTVDALAGVAFDVTALLDGGDGADEPGEVSVFVTPDVLGLAAPDGTGTCWYLTERPGTGRSYGRGSPCTGQAAVLATGSSW
jgi:hypothetical protein